MPRHAGQIELDRLLVRAAVAKIPLDTILKPEELAKLGEIRSSITKDTKDNELAGLKEINAKLTAKIKKTETSNKIKENFKKNGALAQTEALKYIYTQDPKLVVPVLIDIVTDLQAKINKLDKASPKVIKFVEDALAKVKDVDVTQNLVLKAQFDKIKVLNKESIKSDMMPLVGGINDLVFYEDVVLTWFEAILWLEGHFLREHIKALKIGKEDKEVRGKPLMGWDIVITNKIKHQEGELFYTDDPEIVAPIDEEDWAFYKGLKAPFDGTGCTKHFVNSHFHALAVLLEYKMKECLKLNFPTRDVFPTNIVKESPVKDVVPVQMERKEKGMSEEKEDKKMKSDRSDPKLSQSTTSGLIIELSKLPRLANASGSTDDGDDPWDTQKMSDGRLMLVASIPPNTPLDKINTQMTYFYQSLKNDMGAPKRQGSLLDSLKEIREMDRSQWFPQMKIAFKECELPVNVNFIMHQYIGTMKGNLKTNYENAYTTKTVFGLRRPKLSWVSAHSSELDQMWVKIEAKDDEGNLKSASDIIDIIEAVYLKVKGDQSGTCREELENEMQKLCDHYIACLNRSVNVSKPFRQGAGHQ